MAILEIPIVKAKTTMKIDTRDPAEGGDLPADVYAEALFLGLKAIANRGMTKVTKSEYPDEAELRAEAMKVAEQNLANIRANKVRKTGAKAGKTGGAVMTEARRIAKAMVKELLKRQHVKISSLKAADITKAANSLIEQNPAIIEQAKAEIEKRNAAAEQPLPGFDISALAALGEKTSPRKGQTMSANEAGKTARRRARA